MLEVYSGSDYLYRYATPRIEAGFRMRRGKMFELGRKSPFLAGAVGCRAPAGVSLVHAFNGVPTSLKPFVVSCESFLPRIWGGGWQAQLKPCFQRVLAGNRCRAIVPMSEHAATLVHAHNAHSLYAERISGKTSVIYPSVEQVDSGSVAAPLGSGPVSLVFIGRQFGRKGGVASLYLSDRLAALGISHEMHIVSSYESGPHVWTDTTRDYYEARLAIPRSSVTFYGELPGAEVATLLGRSHFALLPTIDETFGFSVLEAMARSCVPLVTGIRALPELVPSASLLLRVETDPLGRWCHLPASRERRITASYRQHLDEVQHSLADQAATIICQLLDTPGEHARLAHKGVARVKSRHDPGVQAARWGRLYHDCISGRALGL